MNQKTLKNILLMSVCTLLIAACNPQVKYHKIVGETMGTYYAITYEGNKPAETKKEIEEILFAFNNSLSTYVKNSTISKLNSSQEGIVLPEDDLYFAPVFLRSKELYQLTDGDLNTSVAPLVNYWGFGYKGKEQITSIDSIVVDSILDIVNRSSFEIITEEDKQFITKSLAYAELDFSSLAKGYGIDIISDYLNDKGVKNFLIDIGGEAKAKGKNNLGKIWSLAINKPRDDASVDDLEIILTLNNKSLATSGNYRIFYENGGRKFAHILNPKTGYSALSNLLSASIIADDCMTADGLATAMMVKGLEGAKEFLSENNYPACLIYDADGDDNLEKYYANGFKEMVLKEK